jgi:diguanylate cyclase
MRSRIPKDVVAQVAKNVLITLSERKIPLYPENYLVWFDYFLGLNKELEEDIHRVIEKGIPFTDEINKEIFLRHFGADKKAELLESAQKEIQQLLKDVLNEILYTQNFTSEYREKLKGVTARLETAKEMSEIRTIVSDLMLATVEVIQAGEYLKERLEDATHKTESLQWELHKAQQEILFDQLTNLYNRKAFEKRIREYLKTYQDSGRYFSIVMLDIDHFKQFNDQHGHQLGDQVLRFVGAFLNKELKGKDFAARYGGEEFVILLVSTSVDKAGLVANNIRKSLADVQLRHVKTGTVLGRVTISAGVSAVRDDDTVESLVKRADDALYLAKQSGRNSVKSEYDLAPGYIVPEAVNPIMVEFLKA